MPKSRHRFEFMLMPDEDWDQDVTEDQVIALVAPWVDVTGVVVERSAVYTFHGLVARQWRNGHVLVAGDAAHQMPPFLGQGMCSGIRDAANLAWKLHQVLRFGVPDSLLDSYGGERSAHVRSVVEAAVAYGRVICTIDPDEAAERDRRMLADPAPPTQRMPFALPTLRGDLVFEGGGELFIQPEVAEGPRLDDVIGPRFAVIARDERSLGRSVSWWKYDAGAFVATVDELGRDAPAVLRWFDTRLADVVVVRPDRYVMWAGSDLDGVTPRVAAALVGEAAGNGGLASPGLAKLPESTGR
jgi:3-(3-hydroxy-phenyl)propionate hydroxylase